MSNRTVLVLGAGVVIVGLVASLVVIGPGDFFLAEQSTTVDETPTGNVTVLKTGTFERADGHDVSGRVSLVRDADGQLYLQFEDYEQQQGPDVFIYVTPSESPDSSSEISEGRKVRIDGGADGGESTKEGTFRQALPEGVTAHNINGVGAWCDQFSVPFGTAALSPVGG